jgi:Flp pilus assembly protein TadG
MKAMKNSDSASGQSLLEFAMILPLVLALALGVIEVGYGLLDQHVVTKLAREGSNLISRNTTLDAAGDVMLSMATRPVNFAAGGQSKVIFSVVKKGTTVGTANYNKDILYQRHVVGGGTVGGVSKLSASGSWTGPDHTAASADTNSALQVTGLPPNLVGPGGFVYVTEIYTKHTLLTPFDKFGVTVPAVLYSIAYF